MARALVVTCFLVTCGVVCAGEAGSALTECDLVVLMPSKLWHVSQKHKFVTFADPRRPEGATVVFWRKPRPTYVSANVTPRGCERPIEGPTFSRCKSKGSSGFPAMSASCDCVHCALKLDLACQTDGTWINNQGVNTCDPFGSEYQCGKCSSHDIMIPQLKCRTTKNGYLGEWRKCVCRNNCQHVILLCDKDSLWKNQDNQDCSASHLPGRLSAKDNNTLVTFANGNFSYICAKGYKLRGPSHLACVDGMKKGEPPTCVKQAETVTTPVQTTTTPVQTTTTPVQTTTTPVQTATTPTTSHPTVSSSVLGSRILQVSEPGVTPNPIQATQSDPAGDGIVFPHDTQPVQHQSLSDFRKPKPIYELYQPHIPIDPYFNQKPQVNILTKTKPFPVGLVIGGIVGASFFAMVIVASLMLSRRYKLVCECGTKRFSTLVGFTTDVKDEVDNDSQQEMVIINK